MVKKNTNIADFTYLVKRWLRGREGGHKIGKMGRRHLWMASKLPCSESPPRCRIVAPQLEIRIHDATPKTTISWRQEYHILCVAPYSSNREHVVHSLQKMEVDFYDPIQCSAKLLQIWSFKWDENLIKLSIWQQPSN